MNISDDRIERFLQPLPKRIKAYVKEGKRTVYGDFSKDKVIIDILHALDNIKNNALHQEYIDIDNAYESLLSALILITKDDDL